VELFELDDTEELAEVTEDPECLFWDVRRIGELKEHGELSSPPYRVVHAPVAMKDVSSINEVVLDPSNPMFMEVHERLVYKISWKRMVSPKSTMLEDSLIWTFLRNTRSTLLCYTAAC
jgi:hypothetical protein